MTFVVGNSEFLVNTEATDNQFGAPIAGLADGGFVITWTTDDTTQDGSDRAIKAQRFDASGGKAGVEFLVNTEVASWQHTPTITGLSDGGFVIVWVTFDTTQDGSDWAIKAQRFDALGAKVGVEFLVNTEATDNQYNSTITGLSDGGFVIVWVTFDTTQDGSGWAIKAQRFDALGAKVGVEFLVNTEAADNQYSPTITGLSDGGFAIAWTTGDSTQDGSDWAIKGQRFDALGAKVGSELLVNTEATDNQYFPSITDLSDGGFVITWGTGDTTQDGSGTAIKAQRFDASGAKVGSELLVNSEAADSQYEPTITGLADGGFVITWRTSDTTQDGNATAIKAQRFDASGAKVDEEFLVNVEATDFQYRATITELADGRFVITWWTDDSSQDGSGTAIKARTFQITDNIPDVRLSNTISDREVENTIVARLESDVMGQDLSYELISDPSGAFDLVGDGVSIDQAYLLDHDAQPQVDIVVRVTDANGNFEDQVLTINVADGGEGPRFSAGPEILVNTEATANQYSPAITALADGGFVITWYTSDTTQDGSDSAIKAQRFDASGGKVGTEVLVNTEAVSSQFEPTITGLADGGFVITWRTSDTTQDGNATAIKAQRFDASGAKAGTEFLVNTEAADSQYVPTITGLADGGFVITWYTSDTTQDGSDSAIKAQRFDASGAKAGTEFLVNTEAADSQWNPTVTGFADGGFVITWYTQDSTQDGSGWAIKTQRFDAVGAKVGEELLVNTEAADSQYSPTVTDLSDGGFVIAWRTEDGTQDGSSTAIKAQRFDALGAKVGSELLVNSEAADSQYEPTITDLADGGFVITWRTRDTTQDGSGSAIKAQRFDASGAKVGAELLVNTETVSSQSGPNIIELPDGGFVITWTTGDTTQDGSGTAVKARTFQITEAVTINGTSGDDTFDNALLGTDNNDLIFGFEGDDWLSGFNGNDTLDGGAGSDFIQPGAGDDIIEGGTDDGFDQIAYFFDAVSSGTTGGLTVTFTSEFGGMVIDYAGGTDVFSGINRVLGTPNADVFNGAVGAQQFSGFGGNDHFDGGSSDRNAIDYSQERSDRGATQGIVVDMVSGTATDAFGGSDTFTDIAEIRGTEFGDSIVGDDDRNYLRGNGGNDTLIGGGGDDDIRGGDGDDSILGGEGGDFLRPGRGNDTIDGQTRGALNGWNELVYLFESRDDGATGGITATYTGEFAGTVTDYAGDTDIFQNIDRIWGTDNTDNFIGTDGEQRFVGFAGNDTFDGGAGTEDWIRYDAEGDHGATSGVMVNLLTGIATDGFGDTDTLTNIENIRGTQFGDELVGSDNRDRLYGEDGDDTLIGNGGNDNIQGGDGDDLIEGGEGGDFLSGGRGNDTIDGGGRGILGEGNELSYFFTGRSDGATAGIVVTFSDENAGSVIDYAGGTDTFQNIDRVWGTENADVFNGTLGDQKFSGFGGNDTFDGGSGKDQIDFSRETNDADGSQGIVADIGAGTATDAFGDIDTFQNIEDIRGTDFDDIITGDGNENDLRGEGGDDLISSVGGIDNDLRGGSGNDTLNAQGDSDNVFGGDGNDLITFTGVGGYAQAGLGSDTIIGGDEGYFSIGYDDLGESVVIDTGAGRVELTGGDVDTLVNIRNVGGGGGDDTIIGDDNSDWQEFFSSQGNDFYDGRGGGRDWIIYDMSTAAPIDVDFELGTVSSALTGNDTFVNIEGVRGTSGDDRFKGRSDELSIFQGLGGADFFEGGAGLDRIDYSFDDNRGGLNGVNVDLQLGNGFDGFGIFEMFSSIEEVTGTDFADEIYGNEDDNFLDGRNDNDTLDARDGDDFIFAGLGADQITLGAGRDWVAGRVQDLDGDTIMDFSFEDQVYVFDENYELIAANLSLLGDQLLVDTDGDGNAEASMTLANGYVGPVVSAGGDVPGTTPTVFSVQDDGMFAAAVLEGDGGTTDVSITITRTGDLSTTATVDVMLQGTGVAPVDGGDISNALNTPQTVTFAPGETTRDVTISIVGDTEIESSETLAVLLVTPTSDGILPAQIEGNQTAILILNDDVEDTVRIDGGRHSESDPALEFTVSRTGDTSSDLVVNYAVRSAGGLLGAEEDDLIGGVSQIGTVTLQAGEAQALLTLEIAADDVAELHDNVIVSIFPDESWPASLTIGGREATGSIRNDDGIPSIIPQGASAASFGDPHIVTLDGLNYAFQAVGEFTLIEAASGDPLLVQVRYQPVPGSDLVSRTEAVATQLGSTRLVVDITSDDLIRIDGNPLDVNAAVGGVDVGNGQVFFDGETVTIVYANGEQLRVDLADGFLNLAVSIGENRDIRGLLGNADGDTTNDLALPDGTILTQPLSFDDLYGAFADAWRIENATSLFDYGEGQSTDDFTDLSFPVGRLDLDDFPEALVLEAEAAVRAAGITDPALLAAAVLDSLVTGDPEAAIDGARNAPAVTMVTRAQNAPLIDAAVGVLAAEAEVLEGNSGAKGVFFTVFRTGDLSTALSVDLVLDGTFSALDIVGVTSRTLEFAAFEDARIVEFGLKGDTLFESDDQLVLSIDVADPDVKIINTSATTLVLNDDPEPEHIFRVGDETGEPLFGGDGDDTLDGANGNDTLTGGLGDDVLIGGEGIDTAVFGGDQVGYTLRLSPAGIEIQDRTPDGTGTDQLTSIEFLDFGTEVPLFEGNPMNLDIFDGPTGLSAEEFGAIIELYIAYYNRAPDALGLFYWGTEFSNGFSLPRMAENFYGQPETQATYASVLNAEGQLDTSDPQKVVDFVTEVYGNVLGRGPDQPGLEYWSGELLGNAAITPDIFILAIIGGAKDPSEPTAQTDIDQAYLATKSDLGAYFSVIKGMSDIGDATAALALFDGTDTSRDATIAAIDGHYADALDPVTGDFLMPLVGVFDDPFGVV